MGYGEHDEYGTPPEQLLGYADKALEDHDKIYDPMIEKCKADLKDIQYFFSLLIDNDEDLEDRILSARDVDTAILAFKDKMHEYMEGLAERQKLKRAVREAEAEIPYVDPYEDAKWDYQNA